MSDSIRFLDKDWVRDPSGTIHAARESEGPHHSTYCGRYVHAEHVEFPADVPYARQKCGECCRRLNYPVIAGDDAPAVPLVVLRGKGMRCGERRNGLLVGETS